MKNKVLLSAISSFVFLHTAFGQGALTPPGAPAPTMKTLDQIEARIPISSLPYTISTSGSYYLTANLSTGVSNAIVIAVSDVTLDLNGFGISSTVALAQYGGAAIFLNDGTINITVQNGHIHGGVANTGFGYFGTGFGYGILGGSSNIRVYNVSVSGCQYDGIHAGSADGTSLADSCRVQTVGGTGIQSDIVRSSQAVDCGSDGIYAYQVFDSRGESTITQEGIGAYQMAQNCYGYGHGANSRGIIADVAINCVGISDGCDGIYAYNAENCEGTSSGSGYHGLYAESSALNCYGFTAGIGYGLWTGVAQNCSGWNNGSGFGLYAQYSAIGCYGFCFNTLGVGLHAYNASYCVSENYSGGVALQTTMATGCINYSGTTSATYKYNMP